MLPAKLKAIKHPLISGMYLKRDFRARKRAEDVLVIEMNHQEDEGITFDSYLMDLLGDLQELKNKAESCIGKFDRVDIKTH